LEECYRRDSLAPPRKHSQELESAEALLDWKVQARQWRLAQSLGRE